MTDTFTSIDCTVCRPKFGSVWIVIDCAGGTRSEVLSLSAIHPEDVEAMEEADRVQAMKLRVRADLAAELGLDAAPETIPADEPKPSPVPAYGDLFGAFV